MYQNIPTKCLTGEVRLSYVNLTQPRAQQSGSEKYSATLLIPKTDTTTKADLDASLQAAYEEGVAKKWQGNRPALRSPLIHDGDGLRDDGRPYGPECKGCWVLTASSSASRKPQVVDVANISRELSPSDIYSGMYGRVTLNFYPFDSNGNRGVGCGLGNVLKTRDGEPLAGGANAEQDFAGIVQPAPAPAVPSYGQPVTSYGAASMPQGYPQPGGTFDPITGTYR